MKGQRPFDTEPVGLGGGHNQLTGALPGGQGQFFAVGAVGRHGRARTVVQGEQHRQVGDVAAGDQLHRPGIAGHSLAVVFEDKALEAAALLFDHGGEKRCIHGDLPRRRIHSDRRQGTGHGGRGRAGRRLLSGLGLLLGLLRLSRGLLQGVREDILVAKQDEERENDSQKGSVQVHDDTSLHPCRGSGIDGRISRCGRAASLHRIIPAPGKGMTAQNAPGGHEQPAHHAVLFDSLNGILGTGGDKAAGRRKKRGNQVLIPTKNGKHTSPHHGGPDRYPPLPGRVVVGGHGAPGPVSH